MSKVFYDHLIILEEIEEEVNKISESSDQKEELWKLVDDIVHHRIMISILDHLPIEHHQDFLSRFHGAPHHESHLDFLKDAIGEDAEEIIKKEVESLEADLLKEIKSLKRK